jgi:hypothetical protein
MEFSTWFGLRPMPSLHALYSCKMEKRLLYIFLSLYPKNNLMSFSARCALVLGCQPVSHAHHFIKLMKQCTLSHFLSKKKAMFAIGALWSPTSTILRNSQFQPSPRLGFFFFLIAHVNISLRGFLTIISGRSASHQVKA